MVRFSDDAEKVTGATPGKYLFKIYEVNEKESKNGNDYWQIKFETKEGIKVCDNFMFFGKAASKTLSLLTALGLADGENFPTDDLTPDDILGHYVWIDTEDDKDENGKPTGFLKCPFKASGYEPYEAKKAKAKAKKEEEEEDILPF